MACPKIQGNETGLMLKGCVQMCRIRHQPECLLLQVASSTFPPLPFLIYLFYLAGEGAITAVICSTNVQFRRLSVGWFSRSEWFWSGQRRATLFSRHFNGKTGKSYLAGQCGLSPGLHYMPLSSDAFGQVWSTHVIWPRRPAEVADGEMERGIARARGRGRENVVVVVGGRPGHWRL